MPKHIQLKDSDGNVYPNPYFPVGAIYMSMNDTNPNTYFGGTWELIAQGRTLVGVNSSDTSLNDSNKTGGSTNPLTPHFHEMGVWAPNSVSGTGIVGGTYTGVGAIRSDSWTAINKGGYSYEGDTGIKNSGSNTNHANWQPFLTCYIWTRTA